MSRVTRRKHVLKEMLKDNFELPTEHQQIVRVVRSCGNNLHEVEAADTEATHFLVSMPNKFRRNIWIKRGDFILTDPIEEGDKVKAEICKILTPEHIKEFTKAGIWPKRFTKKRDMEDDMYDEDNGDAFMVRNRNRPMMQEDDEEDSDCEDEEDSECEEESDYDDESDVSSKNGK